MFNAVIDAPFGKIEVKLLPPGVPDDPTLWQKLEFLCDGQQVVGFGSRWSASASTPIRTSPTIGMVVASLEK